MEPTARARRATRKAKKRLHPSLHRKTPQFLWHVSPSALSLPSWFIRAALADRFRFTRISPHAAATRQRFRARRCFSQMAMRRWPAARRWRAPIPFFEQKENFFKEALIKFPVGKANVNVRSTALRQAQDRFVPAGEGLFRVSLSGALLGFVDGLKKCYPGLVEVLAASLSLHWAGAVMVQILSKQPRFA